MHTLPNSNIHALMSIFLLFILPQKAPPSRRNLRGPKRCSCTWTVWPFHLESWWGSGTDWLRHLPLGNMFTISELRTIPGQQHWETIVLPSTDSQGILGLLALIEKQCVIHDKLKKLDDSLNITKRGICWLSLQFVYLLYKFYILCLCML